MIADQTSDSRKKKTVGRRILRILLVLIILLVLVVGSGMLYQALASANDASAYHAPSKLIDVGGYRLHRSEEHTSELQSRQYLVCRLLLEKKKKENTLLQSIRTT